MRLGAAGARAVLVRSLSIARERHPWLERVHVLPSSDECLAGLDDLPTERTVGEIVEAGSVFLAYVLALLTVFLGDDVGLRPARAAWPHLFEDVERESREGDF